MSIINLQKIAKDRGGKCLSTNYINSETKLKWQCSEGHIWESPSSSVKNKNRWCPQCGGTLPLTIEEMQKIAKDRGGKCLSKKYINGGTKLKWQCSEGHIWESAPTSIKHLK